MKSTAEVPGMIRNKGTKGVPRVLRVSIPYERKLLATKRVFYEKSKHVKNYQDRINEIE